MEARSLLITAKKVAGQDLDWRRSIGKLPIINPEEYSAGF
jgi:hypothetical protein